MHILQNEEQTGYKTIAVNQGQLYVRHFIFVISCCSFFHLDLVDFIAPSEVIRRYR